MGLSLDHREPPPQEGEWDNRNFGPTGDVGEIHITDKALNGFKVSFDGGGTSVTLTLKIEGGTT